MVLTLIICFLVVLGVAFLRDIISFRITKKRTGISFKEGMDLTEIPVITFENNGKKLNFILDSGSNISHINKDVLSDLDYSNVEGQELSVDTANGSIEGSDWVNIPFTYKKQYFSEDFLVLDLSETFASIKKDTGVQLHGILGNSFFIKYKYVLDFDDLIAYTK